MVQVIRTQFWIFLFCAVLLAACSQLWPTPNAEQPAASAPNGQASPAAGSPVTGTVTTAGSGSTTVAGEVPSGERQIVMWLSDSFAPDMDSAAGELLANAFHQFEQAHPGIRVDVETKAEQGTAGLFNYLRHAQLVAPTILPDVVLIDSHFLWQAVDLGLVPALAPEELSEIGDYYPFARDAVVYRQQTYGIPYIADVTHMVYSAEAVPTPPLTWEDLYRLGRPYTFPVGSEGFNNAVVLLQYVGAGGQLVEDGLITNPEALEAVFEFYTEGRRRGVIPASVIQLANFDAVWGAFTGQPSGVASISSDDYLRQREALTRIQYAQTLTRNGMPVTIARTWAFALLTSDPGQREVTLKLLEHLLDPTVQGPLSQARFRLPSRRSSFQAWIHADGYHEFLDHQLEIAVAPPNGRAFADFARKLQDAQIALLMGELSAQEALVQVRSEE